MMGLGTDTLESLRRLERNKWCICPKIPLLKMTPRDKPWGGGLPSSETLDLHRWSYSRPVDRMGILPGRFDGFFTLNTCDWVEDTKGIPCLMGLGPSWTDKAISEAKSGQRGRVGIERKFHLLLHHIWGQWWGWNVDLSLRVHGWREMSVVSKPRVGTGSLFIQWWSDAGSCWNKLGWAEGATFIYSCPGCWAPKGEELGQGLWEDDIKVNKAGSLPFSSLHSSFPAGQLLTMTQGSVGGNN